MPYRNRKKSVGLSNRPREIFLTDAGFFGVSSALDLAFRVQGLKTGPARWRSGELQDHQATACGDASTCATTPAAVLAPIGALVRDSGN